MSFLSFLASSRESKGFRSVVILLLCLVVTSIAYAQPTPPHLISRLGRFKVDQIKGCGSSSSPFTVTITDTNVITTGECTPGKPCLMDFEGKNQQQQNQFTFAYITPGTYKLSVLYQSIGVDDITITVVDNTVPAFEVYTCSGNKVSVKITDNKYEQYATNFNDGSGETSQPFQNIMTAQHTYTTSGAYSISIRGINTKAADNCATNTQAFTAVATLPTPTITTLTAIDAGTLKLDFPAQPNMQLRSEIAVNNATTFQQYQSLYGLNTTNMTSVKVDDNYYCFRLNNYDPCSNQNNPSSIVCSQNVDLSIESGVNKLNWVTSPTGITSTSINRSKTLLTTIPGSPTLYTDVDIICKTNYCYQVISNYVGEAKSISLEKCGNAFTTVSPPKIDNISSIVGNPQGVELNWLIDPTIATPEFNVFRSSSGGAYQLISTTKDLKLQDAEYKTGEGTCYRINYTDACGNISPSGDPACPINLTGVLGAKNIADVSWGDYNGWINGVNHYMIEKYTTSGQLLGTVDLGTSVNYKDDPIDPVNQVIRYVIKAYANDAGVTLSSSNQIEIAKTTNLFSPTAFTPNGDNLNDNFVVIGYYISKIKLRIFDRWGALIFTTDNNEPWNGTRSGTGIPMPTGTYVWKAELTDFTGQTLSEEGTVMLVRKNN